MVRIADSHSDYLAYCAIGSEGGHVFDQGGVERMRQGGVALQNFAIWVPPDFTNRLDWAQSQLASMQRMVSSGQVCHYAASESISDSSYISAVLSVEGGECIDCHVELIESFYDRGVRIFSLTWNEENVFASGSLCTGGLKPKGVEAIMEFNRLGIALDVSHINERGFWDAVRINKGAPCATHSCVYDIVPSPRNLKKEQIEYIIHANGYIGVNFYTEFLKGSTAAVEDILRHIEYILDLGGEDCVGFGSDFCGIQYTPEGLETAADFQKIPAAMEGRGYPKPLIEKICYGNFARFIIQFCK